jgi:hypothetical protein
MSLINLVGIAENGTYYSLNINKDFLVTILVGDNSIEWTYEKCQSLEYALKLVNDQIKVINI